jgi:hypothetical protein
MIMQARFTVLIIGLALGPTNASSQSSAPQPAQGQTTQPRALSVAPNAPTKTPERESQAGAQVQSKGTPANVCDELVAFLEQPKPAATPGAASGGQPATNAATQPVTPGQTAPPVDRPQQSSGQSAPITGNDHRESATPQIGLDRAQMLQKANDLPGCQNAATQMRRAGVALPPGLLALAALRVELLAGSANRDQ